MSKIATTHVGSLPRTQDVVDFIFAREREEPFDQADFDRTMRAAVATTAAAGPFTMAHTRLAFLSVGIALAIIWLSIGMGSHVSQTAKAHVAMGTLCASKAGSARPLAEASAIISARSRSCPQHPAGGAAALAADVLCV